MFSANFIIFKPGIIKISKLNTNRAYFITLFKVNFKTDILITNSGSFSITRATVKKLIDFNKRYKQPLYARHVITR